MVLLLLYVREHVIPECKTFLPCHPAFAAKLRILSGLTSHQHYEKGRVPEAGLKQG